MGITNERYANGVKILTYAINNNVSLTVACENFGFHKSYIKDYIVRGDIENQLNKGVITQEQYDAIFKLFHQYHSKDKPKESVINITKQFNGLISKLDAHISLNQPSEDIEKFDEIYKDLLNKTKKGLTNLSMAEFTVLTGLYNTYKDMFNNKPVNNFKRVIKEESDQTLEEKYDKRSSYDVVRNNNGRIEKYVFRILVRDEPDFVGELSREQMETIFANYPYVTQKTCSSFFPYLTFPQFKKIVRCFNITKDQIFARHLLEEKGEEELAALALKHKEHSAYKKFQELKPVFLEKELHDVKLKLHKLQTEKDSFDILLKDYIEANVEKLTPIIRSNTDLKFLLDQSEKALVVYLSDMHIGAMNKEVQYSGEYNKEVYLERLNTILNNVKEEYGIHKFEKIYVVGLGDQIDGFNSETTRGGHLLPQNMTNREQFTTYLNSMIDFFEELTNIFPNEIEFVHVAESNHGGDFEHGANKALEHILPLKFPQQLSVRIFNKNIEHFNYGIHTLICTHGKNNQTMSRNFPMYLNPNTEKLINEYIFTSKIKSDSVLFIKGDLHNHNSDTNKRFKYINVPSVYGGSGYTDANFGMTKPATLFHILHKKKPKINEIYVELV